MYCVDYSSPILVNCSFSSNAAVPEGGGLHCTQNSAPIVSNCVFSNNSAGSGAGMFCSYWSSPTLTDCEFIGNSGNAGAGMLCMAASSPSLTNCVFSGNRAAPNYGGALFCTDYAAPVLTSCTISENSAPGGAGIFSRSEVLLELRNTIVAYNGFWEVIKCDGYGAVALTCCDVYGNVGGDYVGCIVDQNGLRGNINADPQFCGVLGTKNYFIQSDSPCAPGRHPDGYDCGLIGALPANCGAVQAKNQTWGGIKTRYR
jgi:hypothetical protein